VEKLPESEQNLVLMRYWIGLTHREIATISGLPEGTVRREVATILKKLKELCH
jgi:RNA polymerase sigma factor (sigma-70 family)